MFDIHRIIVPVDFHAHTDALADFALDIGKKLNAHITFVHAVKQLPVFTESDPDNLILLESNLLAHAEEKMTAFMQEMRKKYLECDGEILRGIPADAINAYAREICADLIIISTHGVQGIEKVLLGSVADRVIKGAICPTLVFNPFKNERGYEVCKPLSSCVSPM
jgi:nucleotide-binding universal stress UspA family protein